MFRPLQQLHSFDFTIPVPDESKGTFFAALDVTTIVRQCYYITLVSQVGGEVYMTGESEFLPRSSGQQVEDLEGQAPIAFFSPDELDAELGQTPWDDLDPPAPLWTRYIDSQLKELCVQ